MARDNNILAARVAEIFANDLKHLPWPPLCTTRYNGTCFALPGEVSLRLADPGRASDVALKRGRGQCDGARNRTLPSKFEAEWKLSMFHTHGDCDYHCTDLNNNLPPCDRANRGKKKIISFDKGIPVPSPTRVSTLLDSVKLHPLSVAISHIPYRF